jgi:hypothetical protein
MGLRCAYLSEIVSKKKKRDNGWREREIRGWIRGGRTRRRMEEEEKEDLKKEEEQNAEPYKSKKRSRRSRGTFRLHGVASTANTTVPVP